MVTVLFARCVGCMAGQEECCSHIASVLFYIEAWNRINEKLICTQPEMKNQDAKRQEIFWMKLWSEPDFACTCKRKPLCSEKILKCHNPFCLLKDGTVNLYDSLYHNIILNEIHQQVLILVGRSNFTGIQVFPVQKQPNGSDRGVFAVAFATYLAYGIHPETVQLMSPK